MKPKHGAWGTRLYTIYIQMKQRCYNPNRREYKNYGGRGIAVCEEWLSGFEVFRDWAMNNGYQNNLTLDRIDNNKDYEPGNCRWVSMKVQSNNKRGNIMVQYNGEEMTLSECADRCGVDYHTLYVRTRQLGWGLEKAIAKPLQKRGDYKP